jgi:hypothetical protein
MAARLSRLLLLVALALACTGALAACGGDDEPSKDEFIEQADEICTDADEQLEDIEEPSTNDEIPRYLEEVLELSENVLSDFEDLEAPSEVEDDWNEYLDNSGEGIELLEEARDQAEDGDAEAARETLTGSEADELEEKEDELAEDIGFEECGKN